MSAYKRLYKSDVVSIPYVANKEWGVSVCDLSSYGIKVYNGVNTSSIFDSQNDVKTNNEYDRFVYDSINHLYYQSFSGSYLDNTSNLESLNYSSSTIYRPSGSYFDYTPVGYMVKDFPTGSNAQIKVLSIPKDLYGQSIKKLSFNISTSYFNLTDDGKGNIYDIALTGSQQSTNVAYATDGVKLYSSGYSIDGTGTNISWNTTSGGGSYVGTFWTNPVTANKTGRLNYTGLWSSTSVTYLGTGTLTFNITASSNTTYYFGIGCDNLASLYLDDTLILTQTTVENAGANYKYWHIYPVSVSAGTHTVRFVGENVGIPSPGNPASMGIEIYNNTESQISASIEASPSGSSIPSGINIVYSSADHLADGVFAGTTSGVVGNIFYEHGLAIITNQEYQNIFPITPYAKDDVFSIKTAQLPYNMNVLSNDNSKGWIAMTGSVVLSGGDASLFTVVGDGTVTFNGTIPGTYTTKYKYSSYSTASSCTLESNYAEISVNVGVALCTFQVSVVNVTPPPTATPTPTNTPTSTPTPTATATPTPTPTNTIAPTPTPVPFSFDADYIVGTYTFVDGFDLDTRTRIVTPDVGQNTTASYVGYAQYNYWPSSSDTPISGSPLTASNRPYLIWGGDNTGTGLESVLIDVKRFKELYPTSSSLVVDFRSFWYAATGSSPVVLDITSYSGSYMIYQGIPYGFSYAGSNPSSSIDSGNKYITAYREGSGLVTGSSDLEDPSVTAQLTRGQRLATLSYSITGKSGSIDISDTTTPAV